MHTIKINYFESIADEYERLKLQLKLLQMELLKCINFRLQMQQLDQEKFKQFMCCNEELIEKLQENIQSIIKMCNIIDQ